MNAKLDIEVDGHVNIKYADTGEVLLDKKNSIHNRNMALALARGLANESNHQVYKMAFGNGGTYVEAGTSGGFQFHYNSPNIIDPLATLYNETYYEIIDDIHGGSNNNQVVTSTGTLENTFLVICTCTLSTTEPTNQRVNDGSDNLVTSTTDTEEVYSFDELCLKTSDTIYGSDTIDGLLLSHIIFNPIEKTANREIVITYTLTISVS